MGITGETSRGIHQVFLRGILREISRLIPTHSPDSGSEAIPANSPRRILNGISVEISNDISERIFRVPEEISEKETLKESPEEYLKKSLDKSKEDFLQKSQEGFIEESLEESLEKTMEQFMHKYHR